MGRLPKPTTLKLIEGEKNKDRINKNEPKPRPSAPRIPSHLDKIERAVWRRFGKTFERLGLLTEIDGTSFAAFCALEALDVRVSAALRDCKYQMLAEKHSVDGAGNEHIEVKANPLVTMKRQILAQKLPYIREFGMSPSSRGKISVPGAGDDGDFESLLD